MMGLQAWASLETALVACGATASEQLLLEHFYKRCSRTPLILSGRAAPLPLKTLLFHYGHLRPEIKGFLEAFLCEQWRRFALETPPLPPDTETVAALAAPPTQAPPPTDDHCECRTRQEDWFDRLLNGVRILFFP